MIAVPAVVVRGVNRVAEGHESVRPSSRAAKQGQEGGRSRANIGQRRTYAVGAPRCRADCQQMTTLHESAI